MNTPKLLLHICCGPCATVVLERLLGKYDITGYFFNPNIQPENEYDKRLDSARLAAEHFDIPLVVAGGGEQAFAELSADGVNDPEGGPRCMRCYGLRLENAASYAAKNEFGLYASTLTVGPMKHADAINAAGRKAGVTSGISFLENDWKKEGGFKRSVDLSKQLGLYRQKYCGCLIGRKVNQ